MANVPPGLEGQDTLLVVRSGSILALRHFHIEGEVIHYRNVFGGENTIAMSQVDLERTQKLNADRLIPFVTPR